MQTQFVDRSQKHNPSLQSIPLTDNPARKIGWWYPPMTPRQAEAVHAYAAWLHQIDWQLFATFTFAWRVSDAQADEVFRAFINDLERQIGSPIGFVRGDEKRRAGGSFSESGRHYHVLMTSHVPLDRHIIATIWRRYGGSGIDQDCAKVDEYDARMDGAGYCLKMLNETEGDWMFRNLDLFLPGYKPEKDNRRSRRRTLRNHAR